MALDAHATRNRTRQQLGLLGDRHHARTRVQPPGILRPPALSVVGTPSLVAPGAGAFTVPPRRVHARGSGSPWQQRMRRPSHSGHAPRCAEQTVRRTPCSQERGFLPGARHPRRPEGPQDACCIWWVRSRCSPSSRVGLLANTLGTVLSRCLWHFGYLSGGSATVATAAGPPRRPLPASPLSTSAACRSTDGECRGRSADSVATPGYQHGSVPASRMHRHSCRS